MTDEIIKQLLEYINQSKDFVLEQAPDLINEILTYEKYSSIYQIIIFFSVLIISLSYFYNQFPLERDKFDFVKTEYLFKACISGFITFVCTGATISNLIKLVKIYTAPKYFLIEFILNLKKII